MFMLLVPLVIIFENKPIGRGNNIAGSGVPRLAEGSGANAQFNQPRNIVIDAIGNLYVADANNHKLEEITPAGVVTTFAGTTAGYADGPGTTTKFKDPESIAIDAAGNFMLGIVIIIKSEKLLKLCTNW
jgi:hypothetical protein